MDKFFEALEKSKGSIALDIANQVGFDETADILEKGKRASIGEIREWNGKKYQKTGSGWIPVKQGNGGNGANNANEETKGKGEENSETNRKDKSLSDKLSQIERINKSVNELTRLIKDNPDFAEKWTDKEGNLDYAAIGKMSMLPVALQYKICKEHDIAPYSVTYNGNSVYQDNKSNKPFYFKDNKKVWLKPTAKVTYLGDSHKSELGDWEPRNVEERYNYFKEQGYFK